VIGDSTSLFTLELSHASLKWHVHASRLLHPMHAHAPLNYTHPHTPQHTTLYPLTTTTINTSINLKASLSTIAALQEKKEQVSLVRTHQPITQSPITNAKKASPLTFVLLLGYVLCSMELGSLKTARMGRAIARLGLCLLR
jgi:hypothetical protein